MSEFVAGYRLYQHELDLELGVGSSETEVNRQADLITSKWPILPKRATHPTVLMIGGFQGSGKTSVLELLKNSIRLLIISPDEIRQLLFDQQYPFSDDFIKLVSATKWELLKRALVTGSNIAIDQSLTPDRVKLTHQRVEEFPEYKLLTVFLSVHREELVRRVTERVQMPGKYQGKVHELEATLKRYTDRYGDPNTDGYDLVIDAIQNDAYTVAEIIKEKLQ